ncbi:hypothetical protein [Desulfosporosinus sp. HMP52]|uniref:hypothetical protein n=1 Tax=Desulfosporosinus sp. HMP52 TaxID=1487923 RepID=UPI000AF4B603|nr:hypothetical protein [Desulfosporosinus sp. HMP52]
MSQRFQKALSEQHGLALPKMARKDLVSAFSRLINELLKFAKDGSDHMVWV